MSQLSDDVWSPVITPFGATWRRIRNVLWRTANGWPQMVSAWPCSAQILKPTQ